MIPHFAFARYLRRITRPFTLLVIIASTSAACASHPARFNVGPTGEGAVPAGSIALSVDPIEGKCGTSNDACAVRAALEHVLFRGVPGSRQPAPLISDESAARSAHKAFIDGLVKGSAGTRYVASSNVTGNGSYRLLLNVDLLRNELVKEGVIRRFGY